MGARPLVLVLHCHQPAGNRPEVFSAAYDRCYGPLLAGLAAHPEVQLGLHLSGALLERMVEDRPDLVAQVGELVRREQVELIGGAMYEPVLSTLSDGDSAGQLAMMARLVHKHFGVWPRGAWLAERVWEADVPRRLVAGGARFTFVDDARLQDGLPEGTAADGYWVTEQAGRAIAVFGIDAGLRHRIPGASASEIVEYVRQAPGEGCLTFADDGEKLGLWPGSYEGVHEHGGWAALLSGLQIAQAQGDLQTLRPTAYLESAPPRGRVYPTPGSYPELSTWVRGGHWRCALGDSPEAGWLHARMQTVSARLERAIDDATRARAGRGVADALGSAQRDLYRAQGADAYWRGAFAGVHLPFLRADVHTHLLRVERRLERLDQGDEEWVAYEELDADLDGRFEVQLANQRLGLVVRPHGGGVALGLDDKGTARALLDVHAHRPEAEHAEAPDDLRLDDPPRADRWAGFEDALDGARLTTDFSVVELSVDEQIPQAFLHLRAELASGALDKTYRVDLEGGHVEVEYRRAEGQPHLSTTLPLALGAEARARAGAEDWRPLATVDAIEGELTLEDPATGQRVTLDLGRPARLAARPLRTLVRTLDGYTRLHQGWALTVTFDADDPAPRLALDLGEAPA